MTESEILQQIAQKIVQNGNQEITADVLRPILQGMVGQINDLAGNLEDLSTTDQTSLVAAINEIINNTPDAGNVVIHEGVNDPNVTPPDEYSITDYYWQSVSGSTVALWQYNELEWVKIAGQSIKAKSLFIPISDWTANLEDQIASYVNNNGLTVNDELLYLYSLKQVQGTGVTFQKYVWAWTLGKGVYGAGNTISGIDLFYISNTSNSPANQIIDLGEIGAQNIEDIVNVSGPFNLTYGNANAFRVERSGVESFYLYYGTEELVGAGEYQTNEDEYILVDNSYPTEDITEKLDREGYTGSAQDLKDEIDTKANDSEVVKKTGDQTIAGVKTFSSSPKIPDAVNNDEPVSKGQLDTAIAGVGGGSSQPPVENAGSPYADVSALLADQNSQEQGYEYLVTDASGFSTPDITSGKAVVLMTKEPGVDATGTEDDYIITWAEQFDVDDAYVRTENQLGTHPAFTTQTEALDWILANMNSGGGTDPTPEPSTFTATPISTTEIKLDWQ